MIRRVGDGQSSAATGISTLDEAHALLNLIVSHPVPWSHAAGLSDIAVCHA